MTERIIGPQPRTSQQQLQQHVERVAGWTDSNAVTTGWALLPSYLRDRLAFERFAQLVKEQKGVNLLEGP